MSGLIACTKTSAPIAIATAGPWNESYGAMHKRGVELAVEELNRRSGSGTRPIRLIDRNDEGDGSRAAAIAQEFVEDPQVLGVVGHVNSATTIAAARIYDGEVVAVATAATSPDLSGISPWVFRVISSDSVNGVDLAHFAVALGRKRAAILYENDSYGRGLMDAFRRSFRGEVVSIDPIPTGGSGSYEPYISVLKTKKPDLVFVASTDQSGLAILRAARAQQLDVMFLGGDGWSGVAADSDASQGVYVGTPFTGEDSRPEVRRFVISFRAKYGMEPDANAALAYDATMLVARAIERGGGTRVGVRDWLAALDDRTAFPGVTGPIRFRETGEVVGKGFVMTRIDKGILRVAYRGGDGR